MTFRSLFQAGWWGRSRENLTFHPKLQKEHFPKELLQIFSMSNTNYTTQMSWTKCFCRSLQCPSGQKIWKQTCHVQSKWLGEKGEKCQTCKVLTADPKGKRQTSRNKNFEGFRAVFMNYFLLFLSTFLVNKITVDPVGLPYGVLSLLKNRMGRKNLIMGTFEAGSKTGPGWKWPCIGHHPREARFLVEFLFTVKFVLPEG